MPGSVSVLGLMNDHDGRVRLLIDREAWAEVDALVVGMLAVPAPTPLLSHRSVPPLIAVVAIIATAILPVAIFPVAIFPVAIFPVAIFTVAHPTTPAE